MRTRAAIKTARIRPGDVFSVPSLTEMLGLRTNTIPREIRLRRLRAAKRAGKYFLLGEWILQWLKDGEIKRPSAEQPSAN